MKYDSTKIKQQLTFQQVFDYVAELGGEPRLDTNSNEVFIARTICHNPIGSGSHKLYYYGNTQLFRCWTQCGDSFDIFDLTRKWASQRGEEWSLSRAIRHVAHHFGIVLINDEENSNEQSQLRDWEILKKYKQMGSLEDNKKIVEFKEIDENVLRYFPHPLITPWIEEGIKQEIMEARGICYNPVSQGIIIPHYDDLGTLIGIRERTLIKEEEVYGKYRPSVINGKMYSHPLGFALYNLNFSKQAISRTKKAIVWEGEKSALKYASLFGAENDISVATCGSNLIQHQVELLLKYGAEEIIVAFDKQFQEPGDMEFIQWTKKLEALHNKYSKLVNISFIFDKNGDKLGYKDAPIDAGAATFIELFKERVRL